MNASGIKSPAYHQRLMIGGRMTHRTFKHFAPILVKQSAPGVFAIHTISEVAGTREMPELSPSLRSNAHQVIVTGCSHSGIEKILAAASAPDVPVACIFGGLHLVVSPLAEIERVAHSLREGFGGTQLALS